jgi:hypothetical protein
MATRTVATRHVVTHTVVVARVRTPTAIPAPHSISAAQFAAAPVPAIITVATAVDAASSMFAAAAVGPPLHQRRHLTLPVQSLRLAPSLSLLRRRERRLQPCTQLLDACVQQGAVGPELIPDRRHLSHDGGRDRRGGASW